MSFEDFKNLVKDRIDISTVIGKHAKLVRTARGFKACCPLPGHKEKTPSFNIDKQKNLYYCYGCNRGGDVFKFLEVVEGLSFFEALKELAQQANVEVPKNLFKQQTPQTQAQRGRLDVGYELLERVSKYYARVLQSGTDGGPARALSYLEERGIGLDEIEDLGLGWAPQAGSVIASKIKDPAEREVALATGIIREGNGRTYDFFRGRLMIPIHDVRGRTIGFSGRTLEEVAGNNPKYINSSESDWFKKKSVVYGLDRASKFVREESFVCVVEGYFDQWALHRKEVPAVAVMGTALTEDHLVPLGRATKKIILVMDSDKAGIASTKKSLPLFFKPEWDVRVYQGFEGKDPDEWLRENPAKAADIRSLLASAPEGFVWLAKTLFQEASQDNANRSQFMNLGAELWRQAISESQRTALLDELEPILGVNYDRNSVRRDFEGKRNLFMQQQARASVGKRDNTPEEPPPPGMAPSARQVVPGRSFSHESGPMRQTISSRKNGSTYDRTTQEAIVWWLWHWDLLTPKTPDEWQTRLRLFSGTLVESFVKSCFEKAQESQTPLTLETVSVVLDNGSFDEELRNLLYRGLVRPEIEEQRESDKVLISFAELARILDREKILSQISQLRNQMRNFLADTEKTAQLLREVQDLSISLEKLK